MGKRGPKPRLFVEMYEPAGDDCWIWKGSFYGNGYGRFGNTTAHRFMFQIGAGPLPSTTVVMHRCDNRACVNPSHLSAGSPADNMADMVAKGRSLAGTRNPNARLSPSAVDDIRRRSALGVTKAALAREYQVSEALIFAVVKRQAWRSVA